MINSKTEITLILQKEFAFFSSINSKETKMNLSMDNPMTKPTTSEAVETKFEIKAVTTVNKINNP